MGTLWQFFGFPDPEAPTPDSVKRSKKKKLKAEEPPGQQLTLVSPDDPVVADEAPAKVDSTNEQVNITYDIPKCITFKAHIKKRIMFLRNTITNSW